MLNKGSKNNCRNCIGRPKFHILAFFINLALIMKMLVGGYIYIPKFFLYRLRRDDFENGNAQMFFSAAVVAKMVNNSCVHVALISMSYIACCKHCNISYQNMAIMLNILCLHFPSMVVCDAPIANCLCMII